MTCDVCRKSTETSLKMLIPGVNGEGWSGLRKCDHSRSHVCLCSGLGASSVTMSTTITRVMVTPPSHNPSQHSGHYTSVNPGVPARQNLPLIRSSSTPPSLRAVTLPQDPTQTSTTPTTQPSDIGIPNLPSAQWTDKRGLPWPPSHCHGPHGAFLIRGRMTYAFCTRKLMCKLVGRFSGLSEYGSWLWFVSPLIVSDVNQELFLWLFHAVRSSHRDRERPHLFGGLLYALSILGWIWSEMCATHALSVLRDPLHA